MGIDDESEQMPEVLCEVASIMDLVHQQVINESRTDILNEMQDTVAFERRQLQLWERLAATTGLFDVQLLSGQQLKNLQCQHACDEWLVARDDRFRYVINIDGIKYFSGLSHKTVSRQHQGRTCGPQSIAGQIEIGETAVVALATGERMSGQISEVWRDCLDLRIWHDTTSVPFRAIEFVRYAI